MQRRPIPGTDATLPVIGLGTWQTFDPQVMNNASLEPLRQVLRVLLEQGGSVVDSSPMYGQSERVLGQLAEELGVSDDLFMATKVWTRGEQAGVRQMNQSLAELRRERVELMQVHNLVDWQTHLPTLRQWKEQGRFRYIGVTHYQVSAFDELEQVIRNEDVDFVQLPYSPFTRQAEQSLLPAARETGVAVLINRPFEGGSLFRRVGDQPLPEAFRGFANSWAQACLKFVVAHPAVTTAIPGTSDPEHMRDNAQAGYGELPDESQREALANYLTELA